MSTRHESFDRSGRAVAMSVPASDDAPGPAGDERRARALADRMAAIYPALNFDTARAFDLSLTDDPRVPAWVVTFGADMCCTDPFAIDCGVDAAHPRAYGLTFDHALEIRAHNRVCLAIDEGCERQLLGEPAASPAEVGTRLHAALLDEPRFTPDAERQAAHGRRLYAVADILEGQRLIDAAAAELRKLRAVLPEAWVELIAADEHEQGLLAWESDSAVGAEVRRIVALADYVCSQWVDAADDVRAAAVHQMMVVAHG